jgi:hypothetical protein
MITIEAAVDVTQDRVNRPPIDRLDAGCEEVRTATRYLLVGFALLTALAAHQLLVLGRQTDRYWAWTIESRPTAAFLGAAYAAGFVLSVLALRQRSWQRIRIPVVTVTVFTVLTLVATLVHLHRLHLHAGDPVARTAAWFWLVVYIAVPVVCLTVVLRQEWHRRRVATVRRPVPGWLRGLLAGQGTVLVLAGLVLFAGGLTVHHGTELMAGFWPWSLAPLGAQMLGAWLIAFGVATALVIRDGDLSRLGVPAIAFTAFGVFQLAVLLGYRTQITGTDESLWIYGAVLASIVAAGGYGWWVGRRPMGPPSQVPPRP